MACRGTGRPAGVFTLRAGPFPVLGLSTLTSFLTPFPVRSEVSRPFGASCAPQSALCSLPRNPCPQTDSNRHCADFKSAASANWAMGASLRHCIASTARSIRGRSHKVARPHVAMHSQSVLLPAFRARHDDAFSGGPGARPVHNGFGASPSDMVHAHPRPI